MLCLSIVFLSCHGNDKKLTATTKNEDGSTTTTSVDVSGISSAGDEMTKQMESLKKLKPLSLDELKKLLPEEVAGMKKTNYNANSAMGFALAEATYTKDDTTDVKLTVYDCAGEAGASMYGMTYMTKMNMQSESSDGYTKTVDFDGGKAVETYAKGSNETTLTYVSSNRLLVMLSGHNVDAGTLRQIAQNLNIKA